MGLWLPRVPAPAQGVPEDPPGALRTQPSLWVLWVLVEAAGLARRRGGVGRLHCSGPALCVPELRSAAGAGHELCGGRPGCDGAAAVPVGGGCRAVDACIPAVFPSGPAASRCLPSLPLLSPPCLKLFFSRQEELEALQAAEGGQSELGCAHVPVSPPPQHCQAQPPPGTKAAGGCRPWAPPGAGRDGAVRWVSAAPCWPWCGMQGSAIWCSCGGGTAASGSCGGCVMVHMFYTSLGESLLPGVLCQALR